MNKNNRFRGLVWLAAMIWVGLVGEHTLQAQPFPGDDPQPEFTDAFTLPTNDAARNTFEELRGFIRTKNWQSVAFALQNLLGAERDAFVELPVRGPGGKIITERVSARVEANRLLSELDEAGLRVYTLLCDEEAANKLKEARQQADRTLLAEVATRYLHTKAGAEATALLMNYHLDRGEYMMAAQCYDRLLLRRDSDNLPPTILFKAALAFRRSGDLARAEEIWRKLTDKLARNELVVKNKRLTLEALRREYERPVSSANANTYDVAMIRGNPSRTAQFNGGVPFLTPRWQASMFPDEVDVLPNLDGASQARAANIKEANRWIKEHLEQAQKISDSKRIVSLPAFFPIAARGRLIYRTYSGVKSVYIKDNPANDEKAGDLDWCAPPPPNSNAGDLHSLLMPGPPRGQMNTLWQAWANQQGVVNILTENSLLGSISHDGQRVYFIDDLALPPPPSQSNNLSALGEQYRRLLTHSRLYAVSIDGGSIVWILGGPKVDGETRQLPDAFFLGSPLPLDGKLYTLVEDAIGEMQLVCIDPTRLVKVGQPNLHEPLVEWVQPLGTPNVRALIDTERRIQAAHLAYRDGVMVCPTNAGVVIGVDLLTHSLIWAHSYREPTVDSSLPLRPPGGGIIIGPGGQINRPQTKPDSARWHSAPPAIDAGRVVFTAYDSSSVQCLNLKDGKLLWSVSRGNDDLYLGGVYNGRVLIVAKNSIRALDIANGEIQLWRIENIGTPAGQGAISNGIYYLPIAASADFHEPEICAIDINKGTLLSRTKARENQRPGNLIFYEGELYSQNALGVTAYPMLKNELAIVNDKLKANPQSPELLLHRGLLQIDQGQLKPAIEDLQAALNFNPPAAMREQILEKLYESQTEFLQRDFNTAEYLLDQYRKLCEVTPPAGADAATVAKAGQQRTQRLARYQYLLARGRESQGNYLAALDAYLEYIKVAGDQERVNVPDEPGTLARPDVWARGRIAAMIEKVQAPEQLIPLEKRLSDEWRVLNETADLAQLRRFVNLFGSISNVGRQSRLQLAERLTQEGSEESLRDAEILLWQLRDDRKDLSIAGRAVEQLAQLMIRKGLMEDAVYFYRQLGKEFQKIQIRDGLTGQDLFEDIQNQKRFLPYLESIQFSWKGKYKAVVEDNMGGFTTFNEIKLRPQGEVLPFLERHQLLLQLMGNWNLRLVDQLNGEEKMRVNGNTQTHWLMQTPNNLKLAHIRGHLLYLNLNSRVFAFDLSIREPNKLLWEYDLLANKLIDPSGSAGAMANPSTMFVDKDGCPRLVFADGTSIRLGQFGVVEHGYICLQTRQGLITFDPARGPEKGERWRRLDVSARAQLFGTPDHIFIVDMGVNDAPSSTRVVRADDGVTVSVPSFGHLYHPKRRLAIDGGRILAVDDTAGRKQLRYYDILAGKDIWSRPVPDDATFLRHDIPGIVAYYDGNGQYSVLDYRQNQVLIQGKITRQDHLNGVIDPILLQDDERIYFVLNKSDQPRGGMMAFNQQNAISPALRSLRVSGPIYAFKRDSGKLAWWSEFFDGQTILLEQFEKLPILFSTQHTLPVNRFGQVGLAVQAIDRVTGKLILDSSVMINQPFSSLNLLQRESIIELSRGQGRIRFIREGKGQ